MKLSSGRFFVLIFTVLLTLFQISEPAFAASTEGKKGLLPLGSQAPDFSLTDVVTGQTVFLAEVSKNKKGVVVVFICKHCPFVQRVKKALAQVGRDYKDSPVAVVAIASNDAKAYPDDSPDSMKKMAAEEDFVFPVLYDETQDVAKAYTAQVTPDIFVFEQGKLVYRGQFDDARPGNEIESTGKDLRAAIDAVIAGQPVSTTQKHAVGCSIKWKE